MVMAISRIRELALTILGSLIFGNVCPLAVAKVGFCPGRVKMLSESWKWNSTSKFE
jgi:hypothetical protein